MKKNHNMPDECTACTACVIHCPVVAASSDFKGPKMSGPALERQRLQLHDEDPSLEYCSNCKNCDITCPSGVSASTLNMLAKGEYYKTHEHSLRDWLLAHGETLGKLSSPLACLSNLGMSNPISKAILQSIGITSARQLPAYAGQTFMSWFRGLQQVPGKGKVIFYPGCFINYNDPQVGKDLVAVLQHNGFEVIVPEDTVCCGSPQVAAGYLAEAEASAVKNIGALERLSADGYPIITCCTSCSLMLKQEYQELFNIAGNDKVASRLYDASEFLLELWEENRLQTDFTAQKSKYLYHAPCHLRAQGIGRPALELLAQLPGIEISDVDAGCCGIAGSYGFKADKYDISMEIGRELFNKIKTADVEAVVSDCGTCRMQIAHGTGAKTMHPVSLLRQAYGEITKK